MKKIFLLTYLTILLLNHGLYAEKLAISNYITLKKLDHKIFSGSTLQYRIKADTAYLEKMSADEFKLESVKIFWIDQKKTKLKLSSQYGSFNKKNGNIYLYNNVNADIDGYNIKCNRLFYDNNKKIAILKENIKINSETINISAEEGMIDILAETLTLKKNVKGRLNEF